MTTDTDDEQQNHTEVYAKKPEEMPEKVEGKGQPGFTSMSVSVTDGKNQQVTECLSMGQQKIEAPENVVIKPVSSSSRG